MNSIRRVLEELSAGSISVTEAERRLAGYSLQRLEDFAVIDADRIERSGVPEVVYAESKDTERLLSIVQSMVDSRGFSLVSRADNEKTAALQNKLNEYNFKIMGKGDHYTVLVTTRDWKPPQKSGRIAVLTAGTSDIPYADEAVAMALVMGVEVLQFYDIGVAGIHRLLEPLKEILDRQVDAIIVFAGMEGALPTVVASLVDIPVIGVPVPVGYGYGGKGETALASMLQSCAPGLVVVNIGNGIGAGATACLIAKRSCKER
jgi:NCAIR mutase (PurE)-related protein